MSNLLGYDQKDFGRVFIDSDAVLVLLGTCGVILRDTFCGFYTSDRTVIM